MGLKDLIELIGVASPATLIVVAWGVYILLRKDIRAVHAAIKKLDNEIHNNGFVRKDMLKEKEEKAKLAHDEFDRRLEYVERRVWQQGERNG